ncbi:MAG: type I-U CRISPR-associated protein Csx17 [Deltaproteobacteria bacterium]|nr:MAG: type I-U CRISPR-associated protein Csx17 [Deltaproteobacteria bacterium]
MGAEGIVLVFARAPVPGQAKTRIAQALGADAAARLAAALLWHTARTVRRCRWRHAELWVAGDPAHPAVAECARRHGLRRRVQRGADLGARMHRAVTSGLARGGRVVVIGTDCPSLLPSELDRTGRLLDGGAACVLGPARDEVKVRSWLESALFGEVVAALPEMSIGQLDPGRAGGFNQGTGFERKDFTANPWDFLLMLEGAVLFGGAVHKRMGGTGPGRLAVPFAVQHVAAGFASSGEDTARREEIWAPLWPRFATLAEVEQVFREGRAVVGRREARTALDFTRAARTWGVSRGVDAFVRHAFLKRRGDSYVALPAGRVEVRFDRRVRLLDDLDPILDAADGMVRGTKSPPARMLALRRQIDEAAFAAALRPEPERLCGLVEALGRLEWLVALRAATGGKSDNPPLPARLSPAFLRACDDGSLEFRLAAAIAMIGPAGKGRERVGPLRANLTPIDPVAPGKWADGHSQRHWYGVSFVQRLGGVVRRRLIDGLRVGASSVPLSGRLALHPVDVAAFVWGGHGLDEARIERLLWGLLLLDGARRDDPDLNALQESWRTPVSETVVPRPWALLKLALWPGRVREVAVRTDPRIAALLEAGRLDEAVSVAAHRLRVAGLVPLPVVAPSRELDPARVLAALILPVYGHERLAEKVLEGTTPNTDEPSSSPPRQGAAV